MPEVTPFESLTGDQRAAELVKVRFQTSQKASAKTRADYEKWFLMYKNKTVGANYRGLSQIVVPKLFEKVERGTAILSQAIKKIRTIGQGQEDQESADFNEKLIEFEERVLGIPKIRKLWIKTARIYGDAYIKATWNVAKETPEQPYKGIDISLPDPRSIHFNPDHTPDQPFRWVIHEMNIPFEEIQANPSYDKEKVQEVKRTSTLGTRQDARRMTTPIRNQDTNDTTTLMVNIKEYYGLFAEDNDKDPEPYVIVLANENIALSVEKSPYVDILDNPIPIFELHAYTVPNQAHALGDAEVIESLYTELNDTRNQRMDTVTLNIDPMKVITKAAQIDESELVAKRGWIVHSNLPGAQSIQVIPPDMQGVVASVNEEKIIQGDIDRALGIPSFGAQTPVAGDITSESATGVTATLQAQDIISNSILGDLRGSLTQFYRAIMAYNQHFIDREFKITLIDENNQEAVPITISPDKIKGNIDLDVEVELVGNAIARRFEALQALNVGGKIPGTNMAKLWEDYLRTQDKYDFDEYYTAPQPAPPIPPKVSVSLKGDINQLQSSQVYKTIPGVDPKMSDPIFTEEGRSMMRGDLPEVTKKRKEDSEIVENLSKAANQRQDAGLPPRPVNR